MSENAGGGAASATSAGTSAGVSQSGAAEDGGGDSAYQSPASDAATQAGVERFIEAINLLQRENARKLEAKRLEEMDQLYEASNKKADKARKEAHRKLDKLLANATSDRDAFKSSASYGGKELSRPAALRQSVKDRRERVDERLKQLDEVMAGGAGWANDMANEGKSLAAKAQRRARTYKGTIKRLEEDHITLQAERLLEASQAADASLMIHQHLRAIARCTPPLSASAHTSPS